MIKNNRKVKTYLQVIKGILLILIGSILMAIVITMNKEVNSNQILEIDFTEGMIRNESSNSFNKDFLENLGVEYNLPKKDILKRVKVYKDKIEIKSINKDIKETDVTYKLSEKETYKIKALYVLKNRINYTKIVVEVIVFELVCLIIIIVVVLIKEEYFTEELNYND